MSDEIKNRAQIDFICTEPDCSGVIKFNLMDLADDGFQAICPVCHKPYSFDSSLRDSLLKLKRLIEAVRDAEPILGNCNVGVATPAGEVKIPYALLLTRLNTMLTLEYEGKPVDFHLWLQAASSDTFKI